MGKVAYSFHCPKCGAEINELPCYACGYEASRSATYERHNWGYFLETPEKAVAVVGHGERRLRAGLKELRRHG